MKHLFLVILGISLLSSCIGTDIVEETEVLEQVIISSNISSIKIGEEAQMEAFFTNKYGITEDQQIVWSTSTPDVISISVNGLAKGLQQGEAIIEGRVGDVIGKRTIQVSQDGGSNTMTSTRSGTFMSAGAGSYTVAGDVMVVTEGGKSKIVVSDNFKSSIGPSLYLMLTNHTNGSYMVMNNNPVVNGTSAQISNARLTKFSGSMTWEVPSVVDVKSYKYVLLYCTLGPVFGYAELK